MSETLLFMVVLALTFYYGWFLRGKYTPRPKRELSDRKRKFLLWYVRREISKFNKQNNIKSRKEQVAFINKRAVPTGNDGSWELHLDKRDRLTQLMKWEYSLKTHGAFGEDFTHDKTSIKHYSKNWLEPTREQYAKWGAVSKNTPLPKLDIKPQAKTLKYWMKTTGGQTQYMTDEEYQKLRESAGLPPRRHENAANTEYQDELDRKYLEEHGRTGK